MKKTLRKPVIRPVFICLTLVFAWGLLPGVQAQTTVVQWNFNSPIPDANTGTGTTSPSTGTGSLTAVGGTAASFASGDAGSGSTDPATGDDSGLGITTFAAQGTGNKTRGIEFSTSTTGFQSLTISWDQRFSNSAPNLARLQYSVDGGSTYFETPSAVTATSGDTWFNARSFDLSAITALNNSAGVRFRILAEFSVPTSSPVSYSAAGTTYSTTGTWRFDMLTVRAASFGAPPPDLAIALSAPASATLNQPFDYSLVVSNLGNASASGIITQLELPISASATYNSAVGASGFMANQAGNLVTFSGGTLTAGNSTTLTINVTPTVTGNVTSGTALVDPANTIAESNETNNAVPAVTVNVGVAPVGRIRITEFAYDGAGTGGEFVELTNVGTAAIDLAGWSFDDSSRLPGSFAIGGFGLVKPGESVIMAENATEVFRTAWYLPTTVKVIGGNNQNLGRGDELNIYDASSTLVDRLTYGDNVAGVGGPRTQNASAWTTPANLGANTITTWQLSAVGDVQNSYSSVSGNVGNPGGYNLPLNRVLVRESGNATTVAEGGASDTYTIALHSQPTADVVVTIAAGSQLATNPTALTFTSANFNVTQTVSVSAVDDNVVEGIHLGLITHSATSTDAAYTGIAINPVSVTITDNDVAVGSAPTIVIANTTTIYLSASAVSSVMGDPTDPASTLGIDFTLADADTPVGSLSVTASSNNEGVVPTTNLNLTGSDASRNLKITPTGVGYATINVTVSDGSNTVSYVINYATSAASTSTSRFHTGASDASTAVDAGGGYMLVADDENQVLRLYNRTNSGLPVNEFTYTSSLDLTDISGGVAREVDIESSVRVADRIYWLGSHSNSSGGADRPNRSRLFATDVTGSGASTTLSYVGRYDGLKTDLISWDVNNGHGLGANYFGLQASAATGVAPEADGGVGFNIEGLTIAPDGTTGYLSFRAPISPTSNRTKALIVPVTNFSSLVSGNPTISTATFGAPILLNLGGRGIREIKGNGNGQYLIVAGPSGGAGADPNAFKLYTWTGNPTDAPVLRAADLSGLSGTNGGSSIESIVEVPVVLEASSSIQFVLDNGDQVFYNDGTIAKELTQNNFKKSRSDYATVGEAVVSDLTSILYARPSTTYGTSAFNVVVDVTELNSMPTSSSITVYITKDSKAPLSFSATTTSVNGRAVQNSLWSFDGTSNKSFYILTTNQVIEADGVLSVGLRGTITPGATKGMLTLSAIIDEGSGGEVRINNNTDADKIEYFDK